MLTLSLLSMYYLLANCWVIFVNVDADDLDLIWCMDRSALGQVIDKKDPSVLQAMAFIDWSFWHIVFQHTR